ncbi:MAG TPA: hypothetical protein VGH42_01830 [Verrucomicrobiae bacterium]
MNGFIMHIGKENGIDIGSTITKRRSFDEIISKLPNGAEREFFLNDKQLRSEFPQGSFNCWGIPIGAQPAFLETEIGDAVFFAPWIGQQGGHIGHLCIIKAICELELRESSRILWPETPSGRVFPYVFFFDTESGIHDWYKFLEDLEYKQNWHPQGWYRKIKSHHFNNFGGVLGYVEHLRRQKRFRLIDEPTVS